MKLVYNYKKYLQRVIRLEWTSTNNQSGTLSLHAVKMDLSLVRKMLPAPLLLAFVDLPPAHTRAVSSTVYEMSVTVGAMVEVGISGKRARVFVCVLHWFVTRARLCSDEWDERHTAQSRVCVGARRWRVHTG